MRRNDLIRYTRLVVHTFNSLFEMRDSAAALRLAYLRILSILYLRCRQREDWKRGASQQAAFNSLFEMQIQGKPNATGVRRKTFNSLFEMQPGAYQGEE